MAASSFHDRDLFDIPAVYRIRVLGRLGPDWSERLGGMRIEVSRPTGDAAITTLEGDLRDQAALAGILDTLYNLQMPILSVTRLLSEEAASGDHPVQARTGPGKLL